MKTDYQIEIIKRVRKLREEHSYSQARLATELGISNGQMGNIESVNSSHKYTLSHLYKISKLFGITIEEIFIGQGGPSITNKSTDLLIQKIIKYEE